MPNSSKLQSHTQNLKFLEKKSKENLLNPFGKIDVLLYYSIIAKIKKLQKFLLKREIASKIWLKNGFFIRRGSVMEPLYIEEFSNVSEEFFKLRSQMDLKKAREKLTKVQEKLWLYFPQGKLIDFFYATNKEGKNKPIGRIFFDIDRGKNATAENARNVTSMLFDLIKKDKEFKNLFKKFKLFVSWTGHSFHLYILLDKKISNSAYQKYFSFSKNDPLKDFTGKWAQKINEKLSIKVTGSHEKIANTVIIDPSQTPSGKLARCPFSLHMKNFNKINGVSVPLNEEQLKSKKIIKELESLTIEKVIKELDKWSKNLP